MPKRKYKSRHNKKRNTAFLYEVLVQEITKSVLSKNEERKECALEVCKKFFSKTSPLHKEREVYNSLLEINGLEKRVVEKVMTEAKSEYERLDKKEIFNTQTNLIKEINHRLSPQVLNYFVPHYKNLATIAQILNKELPVKERILLEDKFLGELPSGSAAKEEMEPTDNLVYKTFVATYNQKYESTLLEEQKEIITRHAIAFSDNGISLKVFLNEEIERLKGVLDRCEKMEIFQKDGAMLMKVKEVRTLLESYREIPEVLEEDIIKLLEVQTLAREIES